jgi:hypothetical protein
MTDDEVDNKFGLYLNMYKKWKRAVIKQEED